MCGASSLFGVCRSVGVPGIVMGEKYLFLLCEVLFFFNFALGRFGLRIPFMHCWRVPLCEYAMMVSGIKAVYGLNRRDESACEAAVR